MRIQLTISCERLSTADDAKLRRSVTEPRLKFRTASFAVDLATLNCRGCKALLRNWWSISSSRPLSYFNWLKEKVRLPQRALFHWKRPMIQHPSETLQQVIKTKRQSNPQTLTRCDTQHTGCGGGTSIITTRKFRHVVRRTKKGKNILSIKTFYEEKFADFSHTKRIVTMS